MDELKKLIPTAEEIKNTTEVENIDKDLEKGIKYILKSIETAKKQGKRDCYMTGYCHWLEDTLTTLFEEKGYRIKYSVSGIKILW